MPIFGVVNEDILGDLKRKDHVIFNLNRQGQHPDGGRGYSFIHRVIEEQGMSKFGNVGENDLGTIISEFDEDDQVWYHGIVNHCLQAGWDSDPDDGSYIRMQEALTQIMEKFEDSLVRPMKSLWLSRGKIRAYGDESANLVKAMAAMANSGADLAVYYL